MAVNAVTLGAGTLSIGNDANLSQFESQVTKVSLVPKVDNDDPIPVLSGEESPGDRTETFTLEGEMLQDFGKLKSVTEWCFAHRGEVHPFKFVPTTADKKQISGSVQVEAVEIGGEVRKRNTTEFEFLVIGTPSITTLSA